MASAVASNILEYVQTQWGKQDANEIVDEIGNGMYLPTQAILLSDNKDYLCKVVEAGGVDKILEFLLQSNKTFDEVLPQGGDIPCPSIWLQVINNCGKDGFLPPVLSRTVQFKILNNISGVFQDMANFEERKLFGSSDIWAKCLMFFTGLLSGLLTSQHKQLGDFLLKQRSLKDFLVRVVYIEMGDAKVLADLEAFEQRDDRVPKPDIIGSSQSNCAFAIKYLSEKRGKDVLGGFAPILISPGSDLRMATGLIKLFQSSKRDGWYRGGYSSMLIVFLQLYDWGGRLSGKFNVDCVSSELVPVVTQHLTKFATLVRDRFFIENISTGLVVLGATFMTPTIKGRRQAPIDYNVAKAIYTGLLEYCLDLCDCNEGRIAKALEGFLQVVSLTAKLPATKKAIRSKEEEIRAKIERVKDRLPYLFSCVTSIEKIVDTAVTRAGKEEKADEENKEAPSCEFCYEKCSKGTTRKCSFCKSIIYCSSDCLQLNWMLHQKSCLLLRKYPAPSTSRQIQQDGHALFFRFLPKIMVQASLKGYSILYCIVVIDMAEVAPMFRTLTPDQFFQTYMVDEDTIETSKEVFERNKNEGSLTVSYVGFTEEGLSVSILSFSPGSVPQQLGHSIMEAHDSDRWLQAQREVSGKSMQPEMLQKLQGNPNLWQQSLLQTMKP
ncbi:MYND finger domain containing protein [Nitzschia inconspicua]|uniref:MYND finger domain containing protein n=1 Tax=Nitzschia inconspicua TaxID=303405 RepID=A0A9K3KLM3_9STRA|nr:MYND finger domain containing protein [Nitzschia inconspicua]